MSIEDYQDWGELFSAAEYKGRKVTLNKPFLLIAYRPILTYSVT